MEYLGSQAALIPKPVKRFNHKLTRFPNQVLIDGVVDENVIAGWSGAIRPLEDESCVGWFVGGKEDGQRSAIMVFHRDFRICVGGGQCEGNFNSDTY